MIADDGVVFTSIYGGEIKFNNDELPLKVFEVDADIRKATRTKMQRLGEWPTPTYIGSCTVHLEGDVLLNTPQDYIDKRQSMMQTLLGGLGMIDLNASIDTVITDRKLGDLTIIETGTVDRVLVTPEGCTIDGYPSLPMHALYPSTTEFLVTFRCFLPYFVDAASGEPVFL